MRSEFDTHRASQALPAPGLEGVRPRSWTAALAAGVLLSILLGVSVVRLPPLMVVGAVAALLSGYLILRYPFIGLLLYTIVYMWSPGQLYPALAPLRLERAVGALALVGLVVQRYREQGTLSLDRQTVSRLLAWVVLCVAISIPFAYWRSGAVVGLVDFLKLGVWYLLVAHLLESRLRYRLFVLVFFGAIGKQTLDALRAYFGGNTMFAQGIDRLVGQSYAAGDPNHMAATCAATLPILLLLAFERRLRWYRMLPAAGVVLLTVTLSLTGSRSGFLALLAMLLYLWARSRRRVVTGLVGAVVVAAGLTLLPEQYKTRYSTITAEERDASSEGRIEAWKKGVRMLADRPLNGVGINCFSSASALGYSNEFHRSWLQSHSLYVQVPSEIGLIGAVLFFAYIIAMFRLASRSRRGMLSRRDEFWFEETVLRAIPAGLVALLVAGIFGHSFMRYTWYVYGAMIVATVRMQTDRARHDLTRG